MITVLGSGQKKRRVNAYRILFSQLVKTVLKLYGTLGRDGCARGSGFVEQQVYHLFLLLYHSL